MTSAFQPNSFQPGAFQEGAQAQGGGGGTAYTMTASPGAYTYAGSAATFKTVRFMTGSPGAYAYAGASVTFKSAYKITGSPGAYAYSGKTATFKTVVKFTGSPGVYAYAGSAATFKTIVKFTGDPGVYVYSGKDATLTKSTGGTAYTLECAPGVYGYRGADADLSARHVTIIIDTHDGVRKPKKDQNKEDREDIHRLVQEAIYGPAAPDIVVPPLQTPTTSVYIPDYEMAAKLAQFEDDEEAIMLLML